MTQIDFAPCAKTIFSTKIKQSVINKKNNHYNFSNGLRGLLNCVDLRFRDRFQ